MPTLCTCVEWGLRMTKAGSVIKRQRARNPARFRPSVSSPSKFGQISTTTTEAAAFHGITLCINTEIGSLGDR